MARGAHRIREARRGAISVLVVVLFFIAAGGAAAWFFFLREGAPIDLGEIIRPVPDFSFEFSKVNGAAPEGEVPQQEVQGAAEEIRETLDAMYVAGFVDPSKWEDGTFPEVLEQFDESALEQAQADLALLTLGGAEAGQVSFMQPAFGSLKIRVLLDSERQPAGAVAATRFVADGEFKDGKPLFVIHSGTYFLHPDGGRWLISGYDVSGVVQPGKRPTGPTAAGTETEVAP